MRSRLDQAEHQCLSVAEAKGLDAEVQIPEQPAYSLWQTADQLGQRTAM